MNAAQLLIKCLEAEGIQYIFGLPGEENLDLLEAIRESSMKLILTRHEQAAVFMAATVGRLTGKTGVALSTLGPGATNLVTGVAYAQLGGMPLMVITGQKPIRKSKQGRFQIIDVVRMMEPITKMATTIVSGDRVPSVIRDAIKLAEAERPGAVHIELPEDIATEQVNLNPIVPKIVRRPGPDPKAIAAAVAAIESAKSPIFLIASGANRKLVRKHFHNLLEKTKIPFVTTQMGKGVEDESSELYIGTTALSTGDYVHSALQKADTIIMIGHDITEKPPISLTSDQHQVIHINFYPSEIDDVYIPSCEVVGDISHTLWAIKEAITPQPNWDFSFFMRTKSALMQQIKQEGSIQTWPLRPEKIVHELRTIMPRDGILSLDNGMYKLWVARNYPAYEQNTVLLDNAFATMGAGLPAGIAAKLIHPEKKVVVIAGDGGFMMNASELETAMRLKLDLVILILNDSGYGMIRWKQQGMGLTDYGLNFGNPDFVKFAESFGAIGHRIQNSADFIPTVSKAMNAAGIHVIDCPIDYSNNVNAFGEALKSQVSKLS